MDLDKHLIQEVKNHRVLYDPSHSKYKDTEYKQQTWVEIGRKLISGEDDTTSVNALKVRWKSLRDAYVKERKYDISKSCGVKVKTKKPWKLKKQMEFLAPFIQNRKDLIADISCTDDSASNEDISDICKTSSSSVTKQNINGFKSTTEKPERFASHEPNSIHCNLNSQNDYVIEIESFFRGILKAVKGLNRKNQILVQKEIASLVMNYKLQELEEEDVHHS